MLARVLTRREEPRLALAATVFAALGLLFIVLDDLYGMRAAFLPPSLAAYATVAALVLLGGIGPWLAWRKAGAVARVRCEPGVVRAGALVLHASEVTALRVARGAYGRSVAVARGTQLAFLEVEREEDGARIAKALGVPETFGELTLVTPRRALAVVQAIVTLLAVACAPLYFASAVVTPILAEGKTLFGMGGLVTSFLAVVVLLARYLSRTEVVAPGASRWDTHVSLHLNKNEDGVDLPDAAAEERPRTTRLGRGDEPAAAWLARLDALPRESHAYRGDALREDLLWETLADAAAPVDARMAAARVLKLRFGEEQGALVRVVDDREVQLRIEAALEEHEEAELHLARLGPLFRAR